MSDYKNKKNYNMDNFSDIKLSNSKQKNSLSNKKNQTKLTSE